MMAFLPFLTYSWAARSVLCAEGPRRKRREETASHEDKNIEVFQVSLGAR